MFEDAMCDELSFTIASVPVITPHSGKAETHIPAERIAYEHSDKRLLDLLPG